jgi:uncharacterized membrane protein YeiB
VTNTSHQRLVHLDLFRGYTVVGMLIVNFVGGYQGVPRTLGHHHDHCSYADTIMPQFLFAVGVAMRMTMIARINRDGTSAAYRKAIGRGLGLILLGCVVYQLTNRFEKWEQVLNTDWAGFFVRLFKRGPFETLTHIGATTLFVLPVIAARPMVRLLYLILAGGFHVWLSIVWYYEWNMTDPRGIDGGPLAFFSWSIPLLAGTLTFDAIQTAQWWQIAVLGLVVSVFATAIMAILNPTAKFPLIEATRESTQILNSWTMSQRAGSVTYTLFGTGFSLMVFALFQKCERFLNWSIFRLFGQHALAAYLIHDQVASFVKPFVPRDSPSWYVWIGFAVYFIVTRIFVRYLDRNKLYFRL